jgi:putative transposase
MKYDPDKHHRGSIRLKGYDYAQAGAYFITICANERECLFGEIVDGAMHLSEIGNVVEEEWLRSPKIRREIELDEWVIMPNHLHGIIIILPEPVVGGVGTHGRASLRRAPLNIGRASLRTGPGDEGCTPLRRKPRSVSSFVAGFKSVTTKRINILRNSPSAPVWQRNYYEHVIRSDADLGRIRVYISDNPARWDSDEENPANARQR